MKGKNVILAVSLAGICLGAGLLLSGCTNSESTIIPDTQIYQIYTLAQQNGYTGTYEQWLSSIKGKDGIDGATWLSGTTAPSNDLGNNGDFYYDTATCDIYQKASGAWSKIGNIQGKTAAEYTVSFDYGNASDYFSTTPETITVKNTEWITTLPEIKSDYTDSFIGWFIKGTDKEIEKYDFIGGNVTLYAKFSKEYSVIYNFNNMTDDSIVKYFKENETITFPNMENVASPKPYLEFDGWSTDYDLSDGNILSDTVETTYKVQNNLNLYARWKIKDDYLGFPILSESMTASGLNVGDIALCEKVTDVSNLRVGDIIAFYAITVENPTIEKAEQLNSSVYIHQITKIEEDEDGKKWFRTKGTSNATEDSFKTCETVVLGKLITSLNSSFASLFIGYPFN